MLTQVQKDLIDLLKYLGLDKDTTIAVVSLCKTDENRQLMIDTIIERYKAKGEVTEEDIQKIGLILTGTLKPEYRHLSSE